MPLLSMSDPPTSGPGFQDLLRPQPRCHFQLARWKNRILLPDGKTCCIHTGKSFSDVDAVYWQTESTPRRQLRVFHSFISLKSGSTLPVGWGTQVVSHNTSATGHCSRVSS